MIKNKSIGEADDQSDSNFENTEIVEIEGEVEFEKKGDYLIIRKKCPLN